MKLLLKTGKIIALLVLAISVLLVTASFLLKDKVGFIILNTINRDLTTKLDVVSYRLSFLRKFPKASLELTDVLVHSSEGFDRSQFTGINTDTLLAAKTVSLDFSITDIITGNYTIERIGARAGRANFFTDSTGMINYDVSFKNSSSEGTSSIINLSRIYISDIKIKYISRSAHLDIGGMVRNGDLKSRIEGSTIDLIATAGMDIKSFRLYDFMTDRSIPAKLDVNLQSSKNGMLFRKGSLALDNIKLGISGTVSSKDFLDLSLTGQDLDLAGIRKYLPGRYSKIVSGYDPSGSLSASSRIKGYLTRASSPHVEIDFQLKNGKVTEQNSSLTFKNISFRGHLSNGQGNSIESSSVSITDFKGRLGSSDYTGSLNLKDFDSPVADLSINGRVYPAEIQKFFKVKAISKAEGSVDLDLKLMNCSLAAKNLSLNRFIDMKPESKLKFNSFTLGLENNRILFRNVNGIVTIQNSVKARNITFDYKGQNFKVNAEFRNLPEWISGRKVSLGITADVSVDRFMPQVFLEDNTPKNKPTAKGSGLNFPSDIILDLNFRIDSLVYKTFSSSNIAGSLNYKPKTLTFKSINMRALKGLISGNCFVAQNSSKNFIARGSFNVSDIDVNKAFTSLHNFGQSFLKAENIKGILSGSISVLFPLDSLLNFRINTLTAEGNYHLTNGALINFDPVRQLSRFIELSELENINFQQLDNEFFIRNNILYIPQMDVKSSAVNLSVNGKHSFDNEYEYHVKMLLSQILSKKRDKYRDKNTEFGVVEDDGLGRTSLLLRITGKGEQAKVAYDMKAAGNQVKSSFKKEKQNLKTILNEEYGWFKNDSSVSQKPSEKKPRFRITWDDGDTVKSTPDTPVVRKKN